VIQAYCFVPVAQWERRAYSRWWVGLRPSTQRCCSQVNGWLVCCWARSQSAVSSTQGYSPQKCEAQFQ
jgi:hypothetical protein